MLDMIVNFLTYAVLVFLGAGIVAGVIAIFLVGTWMQVNDERGNDHGQ